MSAAPKYAAPYLADSSFQPERTVVALQYVLRQFTSFKHCSTFAHAFAAVAAGRERRRLRARAGEGGVRENAGRLRRGRGIAGGGAPPGESERQDGGGEEGAPTESGDRAHDVAHDSARRAAGGVTLW